MNQLPDFLYYDTPPSQLQTYYANFQPIFRGMKDIYTQFPKDVIAIRIIATAAFIALTAAVAKSTIWRWLTVFAGLAFAGWTIYSHLLRKDPLMETFYKIAGGKDQFDNLPNIQLIQSPHEQISKAIKRIEWDQLDKAIYKAKTLDGRHVMIVKGLIRTPSGIHANCQQIKSILAFIEKLGPRDKPTFISNLSPLTETILGYIAAACSFEENEYNRPLDFLSASASSYSWSLHSSISPDMANEFLAQL